jgi:hypothetical protein
MEIQKYRYTEIQEYRNILFFLMDKLRKLRLLNKGVKNVLSENK